MDLATLIGLIGAFAVIGTAIFLGGDFIQFVNMPSIAIVFGGTVAATLMRFPLSNFIGSFKVALKAFFGGKESSEALISEAVELANAARKGGLLALEGKSISNEFLEKGIQLCVDGNDPAFVKDVLSNDINQTIERHETGIGIFQAMGDAAPAMGMIGTLIGLVQMLSSMDDPKTIGPAMAVALLTTLYGAVIANAFALPVADKLSFRSAEERLNKSLILESISGIQQGLNPKVLHSMLATYLPKSKRTEASDAA